jgi:hypothetical protein
VAPQKHITGDGMPFWDRWFSKPEDPLVKVARGTFGAMQIIAVSSYAPLQEARAVPESDSEQWEFFATIAAVHAVSSVYLTRFGQERYRHFAGKMFDEVARWKPDGGAALADCAVFTNKNIETQGASAHAQALGFWLIWNLLGQTPELAQSQNASMVGGLFFANAVSWWDEAGK